MVKRGFSLIEVIIALAVILSSILIYAGSLATVRLVRDVRDQVQAYRIASKQMEILRATDYNALPASGTISDPNLSALSSGTGSFSLSDYPGSGGRLKQAQTTVNWVDDGVARSVQLNTLMTETGFNP